MSIKPPRTCLTIYHNTHTLRRPTPSPTQRTRAYPIRAYSTTLRLCRGPAKAGVTLARERGNLSSFRTKKLADGIIEQGQPYPLSIWDTTSWTQTQMVKMGFPRDLRWNLIQFLFYGQLHQESPKSRAEYWQEEHAGKRRISPQMSAQMMRVIGLPLLRESNEGWENFGVYALECAVHLGDSVAALHLCALENRKARFKGSISQKARDLVEDLAYEGKDWRALAIRAEYLMSFKTRPTKLDEAFELAKALIDMTEPYPDKPDDGPELIPQIEPWRVLWDIARLKDDTNAQLKAVQIGAKQYNSPEAYWWLANSKDIKDYSEQWVDLITKAAMGGNNRACYDLGVYWLEKKGWYPCPISQRLSRVSFDAGSTTGFEWLEIAAVGRSPQLAAELFLGMALVCRENNCSKVGLSYLESGVDTIKAGNGDPAAKADAVSKLRSMIKDWSSTEVPQVGQTRLKAVFEDTKAASFLPPPRMP